MRINDFSLKSGENTLRGCLLLPSGESKLPAVIVSHGYSSSMRTTRRYAEIFVSRGYAALCYDFCMSGSGESSGSSLGMSVLTEVEDLLQVIDYAKSLPMIDAGRIILAGCSQGGLVSALAAAQREEEIQALILYYPALCIPDDARRGQMIDACFDPANIPEQFAALGIPLSKKYALDVQQMGPYEEICSYQKPVLIIHGREDSLVPISYSRRAREGYPNCALREIQGDHGFVQQGFEECEKETLAFLETL
jgi:dipeptidyl aminopeptidase/acylaminoacyl peptidase